MSHAKIGQWYFSDGQKVSKGDVLFDMETDKSVMQVEATTDGVLANISAEIDVDIPVGEVIAWIYPEGEASPESGQSNRVTESARELLLTTKTIRQETQVTDAANASKDTESFAIGGAQRTTPLARKRARENEIDMSLVIGSGPKGRVSVRDIEHHLQLHGKQSRTRGITEDLAEPRAGRRLPHTTMRRAIANRLVEACSTIPMFHVSVDCEIDAMLALRKNMARKPSVNDYIIKSLALSIQELPRANVTWTADAMILHDTVDIGVAIALEDGLITPLIRGAEVKSLLEISETVREMAEKARNGLLAPNEYRGGTTTVSNLGMFGVDSFTSIINPPNSSIVSIGAATPRAVVRDGSVEIATILCATFAFDHRLIDGALGAKLAACFRGFIEKPGLL